MTDHKEEQKPVSSQHENAAVKTKPETLHTANPQNEMEGPISSMVQLVKKGMKDDKTQQEANDEKNRKM